MREIVRLFLEFFGWARKDNTDKPTLVESAVEFAKLAAVAIVLAAFLEVTLVRSYAIPTESMEPTVRPRDCVFADLITYKFRNPERGEIITFNPPAKAARRAQNGSIIPYLKRVVAVEGDIVKVRSGKLFVNGREVKESYIKSSDGYEMPAVKVPAGMLFVLGDNRLNSNDSHIWGFLPRKNVKAKAFFRYWPPERAGVLK